MDNPPVPKLGLIGTSGSLLSMRQNNQGQSYFRLEGNTTPRSPNGSRIPVPPPVAPSFDLGTELYHQLDDMKRWAWIPDDDEGYIPAQLLSEEPKVEVETLNGERRQLDKTEVIEFKRDAIRHIVDDLVRLEDMNIPSIMFNLKERAKRDLIYTNVGSILVSVNPYQMLPIYTPSVMEQYRRKVPNLPPHPFNIADQCYTALFEDKKNQAILVSGESGAGKTEAVKVVLQYLAEIAGSASGVEQRILLANPILEAFGNAKTIRNNNSSRFGKWVEIHFQHGRITGAKTINYLLEKTRVVQQAMTERNYHIFYQLVAYANAPGAHNAELKASLGIAQAKDYPYLAGGECFSIDGVDDAEDFKQTLKAMRQLNFDEVSIGVVMKVIAAILHLGNITFERDGSDDKCKMTQGSQPHLTKAANLLAVDPASLEKAMTNRSIAIMKETTLIPLNESKATESRDSLAKHLYGELFDWLVSRINEALVGNTTGSVQFIGVLDIFGFEIFDKNSFEQLCINFTNEKMQQMFNSSIFKEEEAIYRAEGINHESVNFIDNQVVLDLIEKRPTGLLQMLDEEIRMPKSTDKTFLDKITLQHKESPNFARPVKIANAFTVQHYAGSVTYNVEGFLDKNRDQIFDDLLHVVCSSKIPLIQSIVGGKEASTKKGTRSLASQFMTQLKDLNETIASTSPHYIRCIKPNLLFKPCSSHFDTPMSLRQLRYAGVFEAVSIRKNGFPYRLSYQEFVKRFYMISQTPLGEIHAISKEEAKQKVKLISEAMSELSGQLHYGATLVFYKADILKALEEHRTRAMKGKVILVQTLWRGARARRQYAKLAGIRQKLLDAIASRVASDLEAALLASIEVDWELREAVQARVLFERVKAENKLLARINATFANLKTVGEMTKQQEEKAYELLADASEMEPPFEHALLDDLKQAIVKSDEARAERLRLEAEKAAREEAERLARQTEAERLAQEAEAARIEEEARKEAELLASKNQLKASLHIASWQGEQEDNQKAVQALEVLFVEKHVTPRTPRSPPLGALREEDEDNHEQQPIEQPAAPEPVSLESLSSEELATIAKYKNRLLELMSAPPYSLYEGIMFNADGTVSVSTAASTALKQAIVQAQQHGAAESPDPELRRALYTAQILMAVRMDLRLGNLAQVRERIDAASASSTGILEVLEITAARQLTVKEEIISELEKAYQARDEPALKKWIEKADSIGLEVENYKKILTALEDLISFVHTALLAKDYAKIQAGISAIEQMGSPSYLLSYLQESKNAIEARKGPLLQELRIALTTMPDRPQMANLLTQASVIGVQTAETDKIKELITYNDEKYCRLQLDAAKILGDHERIVSHTIELKGYLLERFASKMVYRECPLLKSPAEFASGKVFGKEKVMESVLSWTSTPIHAGLTRDLDKKSEDQATKLFRNVMGWMGDRHYSFPVTLVHEICSKVISNPGLRDEIFAQVIKQLTLNPSADSRKRGWQLMFILLMFVPPSPKFENYVGVWLLQNGSSYHIHELHETILKGSLTNPPSLAEIVYILYHLPPTPGEAISSGKTITLEQAEKSGVDLSEPMETPAIDRFDKHATMRGHGENIKKERRRISDMRPPKRK